MMHSKDFLIEQKSKLESLVIGEVILENKFMHVAGILTPQNFGNYIDADNRIIWNTLEKMYPLTPIDTVTVTSNIYDLYGLNYSWILSSYTQFVASTRHLRYHAILLLELDIRIKLSKILKDQIEKYKAKEEYEKAAELLQIIKYFENKNNDLFDAVTGASKYLESLGYTEEFTAVNNLVSYLPDKLAKIKEESQIDTCLGHLSRISDMRPEHESVLDGLISAIKKVLNTKEINQSILIKRITELINLI